MKIMDLNYYDELSQLITYFFYSIYLNLKTQFYIFLFSYKNLAEIKYESFKMQKLVFLRKQNSYNSFLM